MSLWDLFNLNKSNEKRIAAAVVAGEIPSIGSNEELEIYLRYKLEDAEFAKIFTQVLDKIGRDGVVEIKMGGYGSPYQVESVSSKTFEMMTKKEIKKRKKEIAKLLNSETSISADELKKYQEELARLSDSHIIIWVNSENGEDFASKEDMFAEAVDAATEVLTRKYS